MKKILEEKAGRGAIYTRAGLFLMGNTDESSYAAGALSAQICRGMFWKIMKSHDSCKTQSWISVWSWAMLRNTPGF